MAYNHLIIKELIWIEQYYKSGEKVINIAQYLSRSRIFITRNLLAN